MNGKISLTVAGNLTATPDLRMTKQGTSVANFTIASTPRSFDQQTNKWEDGQATFLRCTAWREQAENIAESLNKGDRVVVTGTLAQRDYVTKEGEKRTSTELDVEEVAASMRYTQVQVQRRARNREQVADAEEGSPRRNTAQAQA